MGYGATSFSKSMTNRLTHLNVTIVPNDECNGDLPSFAETPDGILDSQICAQDFILNRDTCQGDSGGPLQLNLPGRRRRHHIHYHLIGITSYGVFCRSSFPSVYTRVFTYLDWIERVTWGSGRQWANLSYVFVMYCTFSYFNNFKCRIYRKLFGRIFTSLYFIFCMLHIQNFFFLQFPNWVSFLLATQRSKI